eukprot:CAMPEP_0197027134 /NCGR_PEP_ID=MMETSP1384-20130603/7099_1 /TAXON_ID=29189 /ORGANISM="Ammonia sp." /LENGTH=373 /DNA_ID=CAMNT_0042455933 /DNA_START=74 /DNA_END=1195 /DNA_ORIENTATION=-
MPLPLLLLATAVLLDYAAAFEYGDRFCNITDCETGEKKYPFCCSIDESPIVIRSTDISSSYELCTNPFKWQYSGSYKWKVMKKEHTIELAALKTVYTRHAGIDISKDISLNTGETYIASFANPMQRYPAPDCYPEQDTIDLVDNFCFAQMHFHWGLSHNTGSEHFFNDKQYQMEAHFVHFNCAEGSMDGVAAKYPTPEAIEEARCRGEDVHELAVIGVWFETTERPNPEFQRILEALERIVLNEQSLCTPNDTIIDDVNCEPPGISGTDERWTTVAVEVDLRKILTPSIQKGGFYTYEGSLTTPPCTDDVRWYMMKEKARIGHDQMERFREITRPCKDVLIAPNYRPTQENPDSIFECKNGRKHPKKKTMWQK